jgi:hypothetical protein
VLAAATVGEQTKAGDSPPGAIAAARDSDLGGARTAPGAKRLMLIAAADLSRGTLNSTVKRAFGLTLDFFTSN